MECPVRTLRDVWNVCTPPPLTRERAEMDQIDLGV